MFLRSDLGLTNRHLFTSSAMTFYVEGGGGRSEQGSPDVLFWRVLLDAYKPSLSVTIKPAGGKPELEAIAQKVAEGVVRNTIVALDSDFDDFIGDKISHPRVLYTRGYSWENDAFNLSNIISAVKSLCHREDMDPEIHLEILRSHEEFLRSIALYVNADFYFRTLSTSLFPRVAPGRVVAGSAGTGKPTVDLTPLRSEYLNTIKGISRGARKNRPNIFIIDIAAYCYGHLWHMFSKRLISYGVKLLGRSISISDDLSLHAILNAFSRNLRTNDNNVSKHYEIMMQNI